MIITVASFKGGVGKTTTAIHLAAYLHQSEPTLLVDGDPNRSCLKWSRKGKLPFEVVDERAALRVARQYKQMVIDTQARPTDEDLETIVDGCDLLIIPTTPDALSLQALLDMLATLKKLGTDRYKILLTITPPPPSHEMDEARSMIASEGLPLFTGHIRRYTAFKKAALNGVIVSETHDPKAREAWNDYESVGKELDEYHE